ncbi:MAG: Gfo/Idh/MocA family oxidoreductase [Bryobacteraceae bacterium]
MDLNNRREILKTLGALATGGFVARNTGYAANETIQVGVIGTGGRAQMLMKALARIPGVRMVAVCDVWDKHLADGKELAGPAAFSTKEYREILDRKDIDAVIIGTPNHQHVAMLTAACSAGKDVYVEKPLTHRLEEGPAALEVQNRYNRVVQVGQQQRSMPQFQKGYELIKSGALGSVRKVHLTWNRNAARGSVAYDIDPSSVDWKAWLGSARTQPFDAYRFREWRWYWDFGGGVLADLMVHYIDVAHWYLGVDHPYQAVTIGDKFTSPQWETPDTAQTLLHYPGCQVYFESTFMNARNGAMLEFMGTEGTLYLDRGRMEVIPEQKRDSHNRNPQPSSLRASEWILGSGPKGADFYDQPDGELLHLSNWLECIRTRQKPVAPIEAGISAASAAHLGNIALRGNGVARWENRG